MGGHSGETRMPNPAIRCLIHSRSPVTGTPDLVPNPTADDFCETGNDKLT